MDSDERPPPARTQTWRDALYFALRAEPRTIRELSMEIGASEKDLLDHLSHLERSLAGTGEHIHMDPPRCVACGFVFRNRSRLSRPGRCPSCKSTRISLPRFSLGQK